MKRVPFGVIAALLLYSCTNQGKGTEAKFVSDTAQHVSTSKTTETQTEVGDEKTTAAYTSAIAEYIKAVYKPGKPTPDTLFIGKHPDFPNIILPAIIQGIPVLLLTQEEARKKRKHYKSPVYLNIAGWVEKESSEFIVVTFFDFHPQHNYYIYLVQDAAGNLKLDSLSVEHPYGKQVRNH